MKKYFTDPEVKLIFGYEITKGWRITNSETTSNGEVVLMLRGKPKLVRRTRAHSDKIFTEKNI